MNKSIKDILDEINLELEISAGYSYEFHDSLIKATGPSNLILNKYKSMLDQTKDPTKQRILKDMISKEQDRLTKEQEAFAAKASEEKATKQKTAEEQAKEREQLKNTRVLSSPQEWEEQKAMESIVEDPSMAAEVAAQRRQGIADVAAKRTEQFKQKYPKLFADRENRKQALQDMEERAAAEKEQSKHYDQGIKQVDPENRAVHATKKRGASRIIQMGDRKSAMDRKLINREQGTEARPQAKPEYKNTISTEDAINIKQIMAEPKQTQENPTRNLKAEIDSLKAARQRLSQATAARESGTVPEVQRLPPVKSNIKKSSDNFDSLVGKLNNLKKGMTNSGLGGAGSVKAGAVLPNKIAIPKSSNNSAASKIKMPSVAPQSKKDPMRSIAQLQNKDIKDLKMKEAHAQFGGQVIKFEDNGQWDLEKRCWEGYEPVPGKKAYSDNSCRPIKKKECECDSCECSSNNDNKQ
jgi:hypothetical protein